MVLLQLGIPDLVDPPPREALAPLRSGWWRWGKVGDRRRVGRGNWGWYAELQKIKVKEKNQFSRWKSQWEYKPFISPVPMPNSRWPTQNELISIFGGSLLNKAF